MTLLSTALTLLLAGTAVNVPLVVHGYEDTCTKFSNIYTDGTELCEVMWDGAFEVTADEESAYTMWFFDTENNPNDAITRNLFGDGTTVDQCHLQYNHKDEPSPEDDKMQECHPWKENSCCHSDTVQSVDTINEAYGAGFEWDRCGPMTQACERFFVMEACFYECEPSAGLFRKYEPDSTDPEKNEWQMEKMPIKKSFCDAWYTACYNDYFCGKGNFFECEAHYKTNLLKNSVKEEPEESNNKALTIGLSVAGTFAAVALLLVGVMVYKEKKGSPVFAAGEAIKNTEGVST